MIPPTVTCTTCGATAYLVERTSTFNRKEPYARWVCDQGHTTTSEELGRGPDVPNQPDGA